MKKWNHEHKHEKKKSQKQVAKKKNMKNKIATKKIRHKKTWKTDDETKNDEKQNHEKKTWQKKHEKTKTRKDKIRDQDHDTIGWGLQRCEWTLSYRLEWKGHDRWTKKMLKLLRACTEQVVWSRPVKRQHCSSHHESGKLWQTCANKKWWKTKSWKKQSWQMNSARKMTQPRLQLCLPLLLGRAWHPFPLGPGLASPFSFLSFLDRA